MKAAPAASSFSAAWWLVHGLVIGAMAMAGVYIGQWLVAEFTQPVVTHDISGQWWQIFRKLAATLSMSMVVACMAGYVLLIRPGMD